ncbi:hypothetical protein RJ639_029678 [Escallonia herrerae]|uniref:Endonuclease/exonuclease/phosphatase domain-containing protein n=1 Tax=Escallonia herrerae TaxID=1293975 RepID=A0AA88WZT0_9ASTE|nr:hypothetical protein RJ639_029678 [Escallonia herrerae]
MHYFQPLHEGYFANGFKLMLVPEPPMIIQAWNIRGLGCASHVRALKKDTRYLNSDILFLSETLSPSSKISPILNSLGFFNQCFIPPHGDKKLSGGLCLAWKNGIDLEITFQNNNLINALVFLDPPHSPWMLSAVYGPPHWCSKRQFWENMDLIGNSFSGPWICIGDFNAISNQSEKQGGRPVQNSSPGGLNGFINNNFLLDLGFSGNPFTWTNNRPLSANIKERLDKAYANSQWRFLFPDAAIIHLLGKCSDHLPIVLKTHKTSFLGPKPFRFEAGWTRDPSSHLVVKSAWRQHVAGSVAEILCKKTTLTSSMLRKWNLSHFGHIQSRIKFLTQKLDVIQQQEPTIRNIELEKNIKLAIDEQCKREELLWYQKSRIRWRSEGDLNTKFFHLSTLVRRRRNTIDFIKNSDGAWISKREDIGNCLVINFQQLFLSSNPVFPEDLDGLISPVLSDSDKAALCEIPTMEEIKQTVMHFSSLKARGPNGMPALFNKSYWDTVQDDVSKTIRDFFLYAILTSTVLGFLGSGGGSFRTVTVSSPSWQTAEMASILAFSGSTNFLINLPILLSILTYLAPSFSSSRFLSPLITRTLSSSTCTLIPPDFSPGMSMMNTYEFGYSFTSAGVAAMALASRT